MKPAKSKDPKRSALMSRVRQRQTKAEQAVASLLRAAGHYYRLNVRTLPGSPDFANQTRRWAIFVNGCFWHQHTGCPRATIPKTNKRFWREKFRTNRSRDAKAVRALRRSGYRTAIVWECETDAPHTLTARISKVIEPSGVNVSKPVNH